MKSTLLCCLYVFMAINTVKSATYYYRAGREGREIVVPLSVANQEVQPLILDALEKDPLVAVDVSALSKAGKIAVEEARLAPVPVEKLESLEIVQPVGAPLKSTTISETVKDAAIEAIRTTNAEIAKELEKPVAAPVENAPIVQEVAVPAEAVKSTPVEAAVAVVIEPEIKSAPVEAAVALVVEPEVKSAPVEAAVAVVVEPEVKLAPVEAPVAAAIEPEIKLAPAEAAAVVIVSDAKPIIIEPVSAENVGVQEVKSTPLESVPVAEIALPVEKVEEKEAVQAIAIESTPETKEASKEVEPIVRQSPAQNPSPLQSFTQTVQGIQQGFNTFLAPITSALGLRPNTAVSAQADAAADSQVQGNTVVETVTTIVPTSPSGPAAIFQQFQNTINSILRPSATAATVPVVASVENEIKEGDSSVPIIQQSNEIVNDKVDLAKVAEKIE